MDNPTFTIRIGKERFRNNMVYAGILTNRDEEKLNNPNSNLERAKDFELCSDDSVRILLFLSGKGEIISRGDGFDFSEGCIFVIPSGKEYYVKAHGKYKAVIVSGDFSLLSQSEKILSLRDNSNCEGRRIAELILLNRRGNEGYLSCLCEAFVRFILLNCAHNTKTTSAAVSKIVLRMEREFGCSDLSIGELLDESGYTRDYIRSEFESVTGMTPKKYLNAVRMNKAKALIELRGEEMSIGEIAERCGITDSTIFSRIFKKHFGISPTQYRDSLAK